MDIQEMREEIERVKVEINATPRSPIQTAMKDVTLVAGRKVKQPEKDDRRKKHELKITPEDSREERDKTTYDVSFLAPR